MSFRLQQSGSDVVIFIKAVPGASRDEIAGVLGDRLKIRVAAPPEGGRANQAICRVLASALDVKANQVAIESGHAGAEKTVRIRNARAAVVQARLG